MERPWLERISIVVRKCCFLNAEVTIEHLFLSCPFARIVYMLYDISSPTNITNNMCRKLLNRIDKKNKDIIHFFYKEYILISRRYQLHPASAITWCPNGVSFMLKYLNV
jgi:hypothetical protein